MTEMTPETLRALADSLERPRPREGMRRCASAWEADRKELEALREAVDDFIAKCDRGEAKSIRSYATFRAARALRFAPKEKVCPHENTVVEMWSSRRLVEGEVGDDLYVEVCKDCGATFAAGEAER